MRPSPPLFDGQPVGAGPSLPSRTQYLPDCAVGGTEAPSLACTGRRVA
ncbi:hypothetical protein E2C01_094510 [Portunus trituberculatus]|uniref:Uncharacterized protein n=1 Tax=Portunus trituberculatus TaxID=210409 RepID=A0A5B7JX24_PORTR|nr:hypothetical protein [Portunus trituberculatus]